MSIVNIFPRLSGLILVKNEFCIILHTWACLATSFIACSKLEAMAIYVVNQACGHECRYSFPKIAWLSMRILLEFLEFHSKRVSLFYHVYLLYCRTSISHPNNSTNNRELIQYLLIPSSLTTTFWQLPKQKI